MCITDIGDCSSGPGTRTPTVTFTVTAAQLGNGIAIAGDTTVDIEMAVRSTTGGGPPPHITATLYATAPATVDSGSNQIPISDISWTATLAGAPGGTTPIAPGAFVAGQKPIVTITTSGGGFFYAGGTLTFYFANTKVYAQGTYGPATVNYTVSQQ